MRVDIDLESTTWLAQPGVRYGLQLAEFKRGTSNVIEVRFWLDGEVVDLPEDATGRFAIKADGLYDGDPLVLAESWVKSGEGESAVYRFYPEFNTVPLAGLLGHGNGDTSDDQRFVACMAEIRWEADSQINRTQTVPTRIHNDVAKDEDSTPLAIPTPLQWLLGTTAPINAGEWTQRDSARIWVRVASSSDGSKLIASVFAGQLYTSTDYGVTWTARESSRNWRGVASSADGTKLVAVGASTQIYTSTDSGASWTARNSSRAWNAVASSADGVKLVASVIGGQIYTSTDSGVNWTARDSNRNWLGVASSADGNKLVAVVENGQIYTSTDSGVNWIARETSRAWVEVASSADGIKLIAGVLGGQLYTSTDSGVTWTPRETSRDWQGIASSSDGTRLIATVLTGRIYISTDSGENWIAAESTRNWAGVASSDDGENLVALANSGIYTIRNAHSPTTAAPPYLRVADGHLFIQESGVWKKTALSAL